MSITHPIIAVTGSSGAGTTSVKAASEHIFRREGIRAAIVEGDSFHRYERNEMEALRARGERVTHFGPEGNLFPELEGLFREYGEHGTGRRRYYVHTEAEAMRLASPPGTFTRWEPLAQGTDLLFYEGLHGGLIAESINVVRHVDLLIGVVPIINLEWIQKIHRDKAVRGYSAAAATQAILHRMHDYVHYIVPQFSRTDINFQRVPMVDTSNPFAASDIPSNDESLVVIHICNRRKIQPDFRYLLEMLTGSFMSRPDTIVVPAGKKIFAMEIVLAPVIERLMQASRSG
jgi:phosphoribulokinase